jgi:hypothetical protein
MCPYPYHLRHFFELKLEELVVLGLAPTLPFSGSLKTKDFIVEVFLDNELFFKLEEVCLNVDF